jgi:hypothetical protein
MPPNLTSMILDWLSSICEICACATLPDFVEEASGRGRSWPEPKSKITLVFEIAQNQTRKTVTPLDRVKRSNSSIRHLSLHS